MSWSVNRDAVHWNNSNCEKRGKELLHEAKMANKKISDGFKTDTDAVSKEAASYFRSKARNRTYSYVGQTRRS